jgi:hypothetical protein
VLFDYFTDTFTLVAANASTDEIVVRIRDYICDFGKNSYRQLLSIRSLERPYRKKHDFERLGQDDRGATPLGTAVINSG